MTHKTVSPPLRRFPLLIWILMLIPLLGCNLLNRFTSPDDPITTIDPEDELPMSVDEALEAEPLDSRPTVLEEMGPPDAFTITFSELEGQSVRWESWSYFDLDAQFDFVDGELLWAVDLEPVADGSFFAHWYSPLDFWAGMSPSNVSALFPDILFTEIDTSALEVESSLALAGEQILLGFDNDRLVYVETFILSPDPDGEPLAEAETPAAEGDQAAESDPAGGSEDQPPPPATAAEAGLQTIFEDDFESATPLAVQLFDDSFMEYGNIDGKGVLTSHYPNGLMPAYYSQSIPKDFILEVEIQPLSLAEGAKAGVYFRGDNPSAGIDYYYFLSVMPSSQQIWLDAWYGGNWAQQKSVNIPADLVPQYGIYTLKLDCQGNQIKVYLGDNLAAEFSSDLMLDPGYFGLMMVSSRDPDTVLYDDLVITEHP